MPRKPVAKLVRIGDLVEDDLHDGVGHEVIVTTTSDQKISLQELLELFDDHFVTDLFFIFLLFLALRV